MDTKSEFSSHINNTHLIPQDLLMIKEFVYDKCGLSITNLLMEVESTEYGACTFQLNGRQVIHRSSKITPTKTGQFVTLWKRNAQGETAPFDISDKFDFAIITARRGTETGQFVFSKAVLLENGILSVKNKGGKRGFRIYPPWDVTTSKQAEKSQRWQLQLFIPLTGKNPPDLILMKRLFKNIFDGSVS